MKKCLFIGILIFLTACTVIDNEYKEPKYNYLADHVNIIEQTSNFVIYEYVDVRIDEIAPLAALYCNDEGGRQASLYDIGLWQNNRRRATFICK
jgi:hypothetical protein